MKKILFLIAMVATLCSSAFAINDLKTSIEVSGVSYSTNGAECDKLKISYISPIGADGILLLTFFNTL